MYRVRTEPNAFSVTGFYRLATELPNDRDGVRSIWFICKYSSSCWDFSPPILMLPFRLRYVILKLQEVHLMASYT